MADKKKPWQQIGDEPMTPAQLKNRYLQNKFARGQCIRCTRMRDTKFATCSACCEKRRARYVAGPKHNLREPNGRFARKSR